MNDEWRELRNTLLFQTPTEDFAATCEAVRSDLDSRFASGSDTRRRAIHSLAAELFLDLGSYLPEWRGRVPGASARVDTGTLEEQVSAFRSLLSSWGGECLESVPRAEALQTPTVTPARDGRLSSGNLESAEREAGSIAQSNFLALTRMADAGRLNTRWGYDYASGIERAMRRGALLVTTNPPLVNMARQEAPDLWGPVREALRSAHPGADGDVLASMFTMRVVLRNCRVLRPVFEASGGTYGYVNCQVNPRHAHDAERMAEDIERLYARFESELGGTPNVVFKVPGTRAALDTVRRVTARGIGVTITLSFAVDQHLAFAEAIEEGAAPVSFLVMMSGRLDDPIREELAHAGVGDAVELSTWASTAVIRRSYDLVHREHGFRKSALLVASLRGPWNVEAAITAGKAPVFITSFPDKTEEYDAEPREIASHMDAPVDPSLLRGLRHSKLFAQAFEVGGLDACGFDRYLPVAVTLESFTAAWDELSHWLVS